MTGKATITVANDEMFFSIRRNLDNLVAVRVYIHQPLSRTFFVFFFFQDIVNLNVTQLVIGLTVGFSQSEVVLHLNAAKYIKMHRTRLRKFLRMVGEYEPRTNIRLTGTRMIIFS